MKKIIALVLSLMMLFGCIAGAEIDTLTINATWLGQQIADAVLQYGVDAENCKTLTAAANIMGQALEAYAQVSGDNITVGSGEQAITINVNTVAEALVMVSETVAPGMYEYIATQGYMDDYAAIYPYVEKEVNRFAQIASQNGIVTVYEDGTLEIKADLPAIVQLNKDYIASFATESDAAIDALVSTKIWAIQQLPDAETLKALMAGVVEEMAEVDPTDLDVEASLEIIVVPTGAASVKAAYNDNWNQFNLAVAADAEAVSVDVYAGDNYTSTSVTEYMTLDGSAYSYQMSVTEYGETTTVIEALEGNTVYYAYVTDEKGFEIAVDVSTLACEGTIATNGQTISFTGALAATELGMEYRVELTDGEETHVLTVGAAQTENGYTAYILADAEEVVSVNVVIGGNGYGVALNVNGEQLYAASLVMNEDGSCTATVYEGENEMVSVTAMVGETGAAAVLNVYGEQVGAATLVAEEDGSYTLSIYDGNSEVVYAANVVIAPNGCTVTLCDANGVVCTANVVIEGTEGAVTVTDAEGNVLLAAQAGFVMVNENTACAYVIYNGEQYMLTATVEGTACKLSLDAIAGEQEMNIGTLTAAIAVDTENSFSHIEGAVLTAEQIAGMVLEALDSVM